MGRLVWAIGGAAVATAVLVTRPEVYQRLRERAGLEREMQSFEDPLDEPYPGDVNVDTRGARMSLSARLAETEPARRPQHDDHAPMREAVDEARERTRARARAATASFPADEPANAGE